MPRGRLRTQFEYKPAALVATARSLTAACSTVELLRSQRQLGFSSVEKNNWPNNDQSIGITRWTFGVGRPAR